MLQIYDGLLDIAPELGRICGSNLTNTTYTSTSNTLRLRMVSIINEKAI